MHVTGMVYCRVIRRMLDMCYFKEARMLSFETSKALCFVPTRCYKKYPLGSKFLSSFIRYEPSRVLALETKTVIQSTLKFSTRCLCGTKLHRVVSDGSWRTQNRRELFTTVALENKEKTPPRVNPSAREGDGDSESTDLSKAWREDVILTVPNALTISRIVLTPVLGYMVIHQSYLLACVMFVYAGVTDLLDGYIARRYPSQASSFGSYLDPLADKLLVSTLFITLTAVHLIPVVLTSLVIIRDVLLIGAAFYVRYISLPPPKTIRRYFDVTHATAQLQPTFISKFNTVVQLSLVAATLAAPVLGCVGHEAFVYLWFLTAGTTVASGLSYIYAKNTFKILRETKKMRKEKKSLHG